MSSTAATSNLSSSPTTTSSLVYKGKVTHRSWPQLPEELLRHIATYYLWDLSATNYCPQVWDAREHWHQRMVYAALRDASGLEKLMTICPQWSLALETHLFWLQAISLIDPNDSLGHTAFVYPKVAAHPTSHALSSSAPQLTLPVPKRKTPYRHFRSITQSSCAVCRINQPTSNAGLTHSKRITITPNLGPVGLCRDHDRRRLAFCGLCLREAPIFEGMPNMPSHLPPPPLVSCLENEDEQTWPGIDATCRTCRAEWLWRRACGSSRDREAVGGRSLLPTDWETRQSIDGFLELGEGSIADVLTIAREKWWLGKYTRLADMMGQAVAAAKFTARGGTDRGNTNGVLGADFEATSEILDDEEEEEEEDEDDLELLQITEDGGVRDLALGDWARTRILDGYWVSPADQWYGHIVPGYPLVVPATHPCPWTLESSNTENDADSNTDVHPKESTARADIPPTYGLCEHAYGAHQKQMRLVLLPAMRNVVRKIVMECAEEVTSSSYLDIHGNVRPRRGVEDPAIVASRMSLEDVLTLLREEEGVWFDGVDWAERRRNELRRHRELEKQELDERENLRLRDQADRIGIEKPRVSEGGSSDDSSTTSSRSDKSADGSSKSTSPVLSTTTLQTTPSPPPLSPQNSTSKVGKTPVHNKLPIESRPQPITIAVSPVLDPPRLLASIPYVPVTCAHMPFYSMEAFKSVWREACAPLYHCRCQICDRAAAAAAAKANADAQSDNVTVISPTSPVVPSQPIPIAKREVTPLAEIFIEAAESEEGIEGDVESEDLQRDQESEEEVVDGEEEEGYEEAVSQEGEESEEVADSPPALRSRKRSSDEIEETDDEEQVSYLAGDDDGDSHRSFELNSATRRRTTPPKRARRDLSPPPPHLVTSSVVVASETSEARLRKRSSEELEGREDEDRERVVGSKRLKVAVSKTGEISFAKVEVGSPNSVDDADGGDAAEKASGRGERGNVEYLFVLNGDD